MLGKFFSIFKLVACNHIYDSLQKIGSLSGTISRKIKYFLTLFFYPTGRDFVDFATIWKSGKATILSFHQNGLLKLYVVFVSRVTCYDKPWYLECWQSLIWYGFDWVFKFNIQLVLKKMCHLWHYDICVQ